MTFPLQQPVRPSYDSARKLKYLEAVCAGRPVLWVAWCDMSLSQTLLETLRLHPSVAYDEKEAVQDDRLVESWCGGIAGVY